MREGRRFMKFLRQKPKRKRLLETHKKHKLSILSVSFRPILVNFPPTPCTQFLSFRRENILREKFNTTKIEWNIYMNGSVRGCCHSTVSLWLSNPKAETQTNLLNASQLISRENVSDLLWIIIFTRFMSDAALIVERHFSQLDNPRNYTSHRKNREPICIYTIVRRVVWGVGSTYSSSCAAL